jgi:5-methylcytosine-specific restriction endonuclease McrA
LGEIVPRRDDRGAIGFAEKLLELLDEGRYTATYKYAVLLALIDLCLEQTQSSGAPPDVITTRQLADKIVELYWPHTVPFARSATQSILRQNTTGQAEILSEILRFRERHAPDPSAPLWQSRSRAMDAYGRLVNNVEWKLIEMPLLRLQTMGRSAYAFIYHINWDRDIRRSDVAAYQNNGIGQFDNRVLLRPGVGEYLLQLNGLLRPLLQRRWASMVAQVNDLEESQLEMFLFGVNRMPTTAVRAAIWDAQDRRCFYCGALVRDPSRSEVDHFIPWSRYPDDGLDNFVVADRACNAAKSNSLAAADHLANWCRRFVDGSVESDVLSELSATLRWTRPSQLSKSVARAIYLRLPGDARLWLRGAEFLAPDRKVIERSLVD